MLGLKPFNGFDDKNFLGKSDYTILNSPNNPLITYKGCNFSTKADLFIYKNQNFIQRMLWVEIQTFKLYYNKKEFVQCLYIKNDNSKNKNEVILFSQCFYTNFSRTLPFLVDLSNYLRVNIITYEYTNVSNKDSVYKDLSIIFTYLYKIKFIESIILLGLSIGNKINMSLLDDNNIKLGLGNNNKIKAIIFISPTWVYDVRSLRNIKKFSWLKKPLNAFFDRVNLLKIPIFIIHGKGDNNVKYFLSIAFSQKFNFVREWYPKDATHYEIINDYRTKLLIKIKKFLEEVHVKDIKIFLRNNSGISNNNDNYEEEEIDDDIESKNQEDLAVDNILKELGGIESSTPLFGGLGGGDKKNTINDDFDEEENDNDNEEEKYEKKSENKTGLLYINNEINIDNYYKGGSTEKKNDNVVFNDDDYYGHYNNKDIMISNNNVIDEEAIEYNENNEGGLGAGINNMNNGRSSYVSFLPGDVIPSVKGKEVKDNVSINKSGLYRPPSRTKSFISFK